MKKNGRKFSVDINFDQVSIDRLDEIAETCDLTRSAAARFVIADYYRLRKIVEKKIAA
jgi:predicted transcriptional regulator